MRHWFLRILTAIALATATARAEIPSNLGTFVPGNVVVYATADGIDALEAPMVAMLEAMSPGMGLLAQALLVGPWVEQIARDRPIAFWLLSSGTQVLALPTDDPSALAGLLQALPGETARMLVPGPRHSLLVTGGDFELESLAESPPAPPPSLAGAVRGFVDVERLEGWYHETIGKLVPADPDTEPDVSSLSLGARRVDFAARPSRAGLEVALSVMPTASGSLAALARARVPATPNRFVAALPSGSAVVGTMRVTPEVAAWGGGASMPPLPPSMTPAERRRLRRGLRYSRLWWALTRGDSAFALDVAPEGRGLLGVQVGTCRDARRVRRLVRAMARQMRRADPDIPLRSRFRPAATQVAGLPVDAQILTLRSTAEPEAAAIARRFLATPVLHAYPEGAAITAYGRGGLAHLRDAALLLRRSAAPDPTLARLLPDEAIVAVAMSPHALARFAGIATATALPAGTPGEQSRADHAAFVVIPRGETLDVRLTIPAAFLRHAAADVAKLAPTWTATLPGA